MDVMRAMQNLSDARARQEMQKDPWLKKLDKVCEDVEGLAESADVDELQKLMNFGKEVMRVANIRMEQIRAADIFGTDYDEDDDEDEDEDEDE